MNKLCTRNGTTKTLSLNPSAEIMYTWWRPPGVLCLVFCANILFILVGILFHFKNRLGTNCQSTVSLWLTFATTGTVNLVPRALFSTNGTEVRHILGIKYSFVGSKLILFNFKTHKVYRLIPISTWDTNNNNSKSNNWTPSDNNFCVAFTFTVSHFPAYHPRTYQERVSGTEGISITRLVLPGI